MVVGLVTMGTSVIDSEGWEHFSSKIYAFLDVSSNKTKNNAIIL